MRPPVVGVLLPVGLVPWKEFLVTAEGEMLIVESWHMVVSTFRQKTGNSESGLRLQLLPQKMALEQRIGTVLEVAGVLERHVELTLTGKVVVVKTHAGTVS